MELLGLDSENIKAVIFLCFFQPFDQLFMILRLKFKSSANDPVDQIRLVVCNAIWVERAFRHVVIKTIAEYIFVFSIKWRITMYIQGIISPIIMAVKDSFR